MLLLGIRKSTHVCLLCWRDFWGSTSLCKVICCCQNSIIFFPIFLVKRIQFFILGQILVFFFLIYFLFSRIGVINFVNNKVVFLQISDLIVSKHFILDKFVPIWETKCMRNLNLFFKESFLKMGEYWSFSLNFLGLILGQFDNLSRKWAQIHENLLCNFLFLCLNFSL